MPCTITDVVLDLLSSNVPAPLVGVRVVARPVFAPIFAAVPAFHPVNNPERSVITDNTGAWSFILPWPSEQDPAPTAWQLITPDLSIWQGAIPEAVNGPVSLHDLKQLYGWGLVSGGLQRAVPVAVAGPPGPSGGPSPIQAATASVLEGASLHPGAIAWVQDSKSMFMSDAVELKWRSTTTGLKLDRYLQRLLGRGVANIWDPQAYFPSNQILPPNLTRSSLGPLVSVNMVGVGYQAAALYPAAAHPGLLCSGTPPFFQLLDLIVPPFTYQWFFQPHGYSAANKYNACGTGNFYLSTTVAGKLQLRGTGGALLIDGPTLTLEQTYLLTLGVVGTTAYLIVDGVLIGTFTGALDLSNSFELNLIDGNFSWQLLSADYVAPSASVALADKNASLVTAG